MTTTTGTDGWHQTACILCECNCGLEVRLDGRRFERIRGDKAHPASKGYTCEKALRIDHYQNTPHRLQTPLRRNASGSFDPITWEVAIAEVAERLASVRDRFGGETIFFYGGGGQGNHLGGPSMRSLMGALGARYRANALSQEKTGEFWVDHRLLGAHTRGDYHHAEVAIFLGKNPWMSHSIPEARRTLKAIAADPGRTLVVIDPRRTETAEMADVWLPVRPGTDAWLVAALAAALVQEDLVDWNFLSAHTTGSKRVVAALATVPVDDYARLAGVEPTAVRHLARRMAAAASVSIFEDLGVQQGPHSTLISYLEKLCWILVGSFAKPGGMHVHTELFSLTHSQPDDTTVTPVAGAPIIAGLVPCNVVAEEILTDHRDRYRAMVVQSANPAHSVADSARFREALAALELVVAIDVVETETTRMAHYVLPSASQYEKWECTFFNFEFPDNVFHLRPPLLGPLPGTLTEPEIHSRLLDALGAFDGIDVAGLRAAALESRAAFAQAFGAAVAAHPKVMALAPALVRETLGPTLPEGMENTATLWLAAQRAVSLYAQGIRGAGITVPPGGTLADGLFDAMISSPGGLRFSADRHEDNWAYVEQPDHKIAMEIPELLAELAGLAAGPPRHVTAEFPLVLSAGERRSFTANTILRDPAWRKRDPHGALRVSPADAAAYGLTDGAPARLRTERGEAQVLVAVDDTMLAGHIALPNGMGTDYPNGEAGPAREGVPPNELTSSTWRDPIALTPWHKHVPARLEPAG